MAQTQSVILLADESRFFLSMEKQFLRNVPATVVETQSAAQALQFCRTTPPDLIFLADTLADCDGLSCCRELRADPALAAIPVIFVCENGAASHPPADGAGGCHAVLAKPLDRQRFLEAGRKFLAGIREHRRSCLIGVSLGAQGEVIEGKGLDLSSGGLFFELARPLPIGTGVELDLHLARPHESGPRIAASGMVAWHNARHNPTKAHHPAGMGIKFTRIAPRAAEILADYLKRLDERHSG